MKTNVITHPLIIYPLLLDDVPSIDTVYPYVHGAPSAPTHNLVLLPTCSDMGEPLDINEELVTVGWSNLLSGCTGGFTGRYLVLVCSHETVSCFLCTRTHFMLAKQVHLEVLAKVHPASTTELSKSKNNSI